MLHIKNKSKLRFCYLPVSYHSDVEILKWTQWCGVSPAINSVKNEYVDSMIEKGTTFVQTSLNWKATEQHGVPPANNSVHKPHLPQWTWHINHTRKWYDMHVRIQNHVTQLASEGEVVCCRGCLLLKVGVMSISVSKLLSRGKRILFVLDIL